jgi:hypothetical protein
MEGPNLVVFVAGRIMAPLTPASTLAHAYSPKTRAKIVSACLK